MVSAMSKTTASFTADHLAGRWFRFLAATGILLVIVFGLAPLPIRYFAPMTHYVENAERNGIHPGALYYTDVSVSRMAEYNSRDTVRYFYELQKKRGALASR